MQVNALGGGDTGAPAGEGQPDRPRLVSHRLGGRSDDRLARRARPRCRLVLLGVVPRPAPPVWTAASEVGRVDWRDLDLPEGYIEDPAEREAVLDGKPAHWRKWYEGELVSNYEAPAKGCPRP